MKPTHYYNDFETGEWLRNLIAAKLIPEGDVDDRSILEIKPDEIREYTQCHFFAGIAGWPRALKLAGWDTNRPVWSASLPCQPFSCAGQQRGEKDKRHLWPVFFELVEECRPTVVIGEQTSSKDGREWLAGVQTDLETLGYSCAATDLPAASIGAPHKRNRLFWVANAESFGLQEPREKQRCSFEASSPTGRVADHSSKRLEGATGTGIQGRSDRPPNGSFWSNSIAIPCADGKFRRVPGRVADSISERRYAAEPITRTLKCCNGKSITTNAERRVQNHKSEYQLEIKPALFPLADGIPSRVGLLKGAGNAIVPQVAAEFIKCVMEII